ncbi:Protein FAM60A [Tupaia chinensis]|uniref:Protein FAM60A n=1 Tax=Tupaia chinensis TaxID=246437 RepID=L8Y967_TUPCH|nr:Protein FAM60A [Tupaia chinensis]
MFGFHKPKMYRSIEGCCICRAKSSSSRFTDSKRYEKDFQSCFGQKICCGIIYKGRFGEVLIDTHLFKPCCSNKKAAAEKPEEQGPEPLPISTQEW